MNGHNIFPKKATVVVEDNSHRANRYGSMLSANNREVLQQATTTRERIALHFMRPTIWINLMLRNSINEYFCEMLNNTK